MHKPIDREALFAAIDDDRTDAVSINALGDWFEENGDSNAAVCLRWVTRNGRRPSSYPRPSILGPYLWVRQEQQPIIEDPAAQIPEKLWLELKDNDETEAVASFKSYRSPRAAYVALVEAWRALGEPVADVT